MLESPFDKAAEAFEAKAQTANPCLFIQFAVEHDGSKVNLGQMQSLLFSQHDAREDGLWQRERAGHSMRSAQQWPSHEHQNAFFHVSGSVSRFHVSSLLHIPLWALLDPKTLQENMAEWQNLCQYTYICTIHVRSICDRTSWSAGTTAVS